MGAQLSRSMHAREELSGPGKSHLEGLEVTAASTHRGPGTVPAPTSQTENPRGSQALDTVREGFTSVVGNS